MTRLWRVFFVCVICSLSVLILSEGTIFSWSFQQPTYLLEKDTAGLGSYTCDISQEICKVNFDFTASVPTDEPSTQYSCLIDFGFWVTGEENKCNPSTVEFPLWSWNVHLIVKKIADDSIVNEWTMQIIHPDDSIDPLRVTYTREWQSPSYLLLKDDLTLTEYSCDPWETECKVNLKISPFYDGVESSDLACEITSDFELVPTSDLCNPNTSIVPVGEHILTIKILDKSDATILQTSTITLKNTPPDTTIDPTRVITEIAWQQPTYLLEKDDTSKEKYTCDPEKTECKVNLLVIPKLDGAESSQLTCHITTDFGLEEDDCNPDTFIVPTGTHILTLETKNASTWSVISTRTISLHWLPVIENPPSGSWSGWGSASPMLDLSSIQIAIQSGLDEAWVCKTEICQVNFMTIAPETSMCLWNFGSGVFETALTDEKCNPGYVKFSVDTTVTLTVTDPNYPSNTVTKTMQVYRTKNTLQSSVLTAQIGLQTKITSTKRLTDTGILCAWGKAQKCSLNFTAEGSTGAKTWYWDFWNGETSDKENPWYQSYEIGKYRAQLTVSDGVTTDTAMYDVEIVENFEQEEVCLECEKIRGKIQISAVLPNPPHADTVEWIELTNISPESLSLDFCEISDESESHWLSGVLGWGKTLRLRQALTGLTLGNTHESLALICGENLIDTFTWDFSVPSGYILRRDVLMGRPQKTTVLGVIDGDTLDVILEGKKTRIRLLGIDTPETVHPRKPVEEFGKEASDFTKRTLLNQEIWLTFDHEPIDHYGRRLAYIWQCGSSFSESSCILFNAQVVSQGYGRMERRFQFRKYDEFDAFEKEAKKAKLWIWSDPEMAKEMNILGDEEEDLLTLEQEKEFLKLQEELLRECGGEEDPKLCEEEKPKWQDVTKKISTLTVSPKKSGIVTISGRTWWDFPLGIEIYQGEKLIHKISTKTNEIGEYEEAWIPELIGEYSVKVLLREEKKNTSDGEIEIVNVEKTVSVEVISDHFASPLQASIVLQGQKTDNRWQEWDTFHCRSRESCSVNVTAETNRSDNVDYLWIFPDGSVTDEKNPLNLKLDYGQYDIMLIMTDGITEEVAIAAMHIDHQAIPRASKKSTGSPSAKYTLDLKDMPQDIGGGGVVPEEQNPLKKLLVSFAILWILASGVYTFRLR